MTKQGRVEEHRIAAHPYSVHLKTDIPALKSLFRRYLIPQGPAARRNPVVTLVARRQDHDLTQRLDKDASRCFDHSPDPQAIGPDRFWFEGRVPAGNLLLSSWFSGPRVHLNRSTQTIEASLPGDTAERIDPRTLLELLWIKPVECLLMSHGLPVLHAACVWWGFSSLLILGDSGAGKTTISAALAKGGGRIFSDDRTSLRLENGSCWAQGISTWPRTKSLLLQKQLGCSRSEEARLPLKWMDRTNRWVPVHALLFPRYSSGPLRLRRIPPAMAERALTRLHLPGYLSSLQSKYFTRLTLRSLSLLAHTLPAFSLQYQDKALARVAALVGTAVRGKIVP